MVAPTLLWLRKHLPVFLYVQIERLYYGYHKARHLWPVWFYILNFSARRRYLKNRSALSPEAAAIVEGLGRDGIVFTHITELPLAEDFEELRAHVFAKWNDPATQAQFASRHVSPEHRGDKYYNIDLWGTPKVLDLANPLIRFSLDDQILAIANAYLEMYTKFMGLNLWVSLPVPGGAAEHASQRWHRDPEDKKILKAFLYFDDVDEGAGPFTYVRGSQLGGEWRHIFPQRPPLGYYPPPGTVEKAVPARDIVVGTGRAGTLIFCDTSGLHKGGYCRSKNRYMYQTIYGSSASLEPINYLYPAHFDASGLSPAARYAVEPAS